MNYNVAGYIIFFIVIFFITIHLGYVFYKNGEHYIHMLLPDDPHLVSSINNLLLIGYYLLNLGYSTVSIVRWPEIDSLEYLISYLASHAGFIIFMLAVIHYFNMLWLLAYSKYIQKHKKESIKV